MDFLIIYIYKYYCIVLYRTFGNITLINIDTSPQLLICIFKINNLESSDFFFSCVIASSYFPFVADSFSTSQFLSKQQTNNFWSEIIISVSQH